jgi:GT2 family glycosyltransferase
MPISIAGMHRSGTSLSAQLLHLCGIYLGPEEDLRNPAPDNLDGFWEHPEFVGLNDRLLAHLGGGWDSPPAEPDFWEGLGLKSFRLEGERLVRDCAAHGAWGWKDPRNSLTLPFWQSLVPALKVVICLRHPLEVAGSLARRHGLSLYFGLNLWRATYERLLAEVAPADRVVSHYSAYFCDPAAELRRVLRLLEIPASDEVIDRACAAVKPSYRNQHVAAPELAQVSLSRAVIDCYLSLCAEAGPVCERATEGAWGGQTVLAAADAPATSLRIFRGDAEYCARSDAYDPQAGRPGDDSALIISGTVAGLRALLDLKETALQGLRAERNTSQEGLRAALNTSQQMKTALTERDAIIRQRDGGIDYLRGEWDRARHIIEVLDAHVRTGLHALTGQVVEDEQSPQELAARLAALLGGRAGRMLQAVRRFRQLLVPGGGRREQAVHAVLRLLRKARAKGWKGILRAAGRRLKACGATVQMHARAQSGPTLAEVCARVRDSKGVVIFLPSIGWKVQLFQRPQQLAREFARQGWVAVFDCSNAADLVSGFAEVETNLFLYKGPEDQLHQLPSPLLWTFTYNFERTSTYPETARTVYDWIDDLAVFPHEAAFLRENHARALREATYVASVSRRLHEQLRAVRPDALYLPNGVEAERFAAPGAPPADRALARIRRQGKPIAGYYGALASWFDYDLLDRVARMRPDWNFVLIGPNFDDSLTGQPLLSRANVTWLGPRPYETLPGYLRLFDVALIPFLINDITLATSPLKLFEYFAGGKPVITTPLPECQVFPEVLITRNAEELAQSLDRARQLGQDEEHVLKLRELARANSWTKRVQQTLAHMERRDAMNLVASADPGPTLLPALPLEQREKILNQPTRPGPRRRPDVVCFSIIDWSFRYQRPQQLMSQFAAQGHRVFYINLTQHLPGGTTPPFRLREIKPNVFDLSLAVSSPPDIYGAVVAGDPLDAILAALGELRHSQGMEEVIGYVMISSWGEVALEARRRWGWRVVYDCMDEWETFPGIKQAIIDMERRLVPQSDLLVVTAQRLLDKWRSRERPTVLARNAADYEFYAQRCRPNNILTGVRAPVVGYYGAIADWFDLDLLARTAAARPGYTFILLGGVFDVDVSRLKALPNVRLLGQQPYETMPQYLYHFDVCLIPFKINAVTEATDPVKLYEYLSAGKPVVCTALPEVEPYREYVYLARDADDFLRQLDAAVAEDDPQWRERRRAMARRHTWHDRWQRIDAALTESTPRASIIVVTYNNLALTRLCLESILRNTEHPNYEIVVVDNASDDGTPAYLRYLAAECPQVTVLLNEGNHGFARANNEGIARATGEYLVLLNNDTVVPPGWLSRLLRHLADPEVGLVGPVTNFVGNEARVEVDYRNVAEMEAFAREHTWARDGEAADIHMLAMYCVALRRSTYEQVGLLDEQFGIGMFEDDDYAIRIRQAGLRVVCALDAFVHHFGQAAFGQLIKTGEYNPLFEENRRRYEAKWQVAWVAHKHGTLRPTSTSRRRTAA